MLRSEVFPDPEGPIMAVTCPFGTSPQISLRMYFGSSSLCFGASTMLTFFHVKSRPSRFLKGSARLLIVSPPLLSRLRLPMPTILFLPPSTAAPGPPLRSAISVSGSATEGDESEAASKSRSWPSLWLRPAVASVMVQLLLVGTSSEEESDNNFIPLLLPFVFCFVFG